MAEGSDLARVRAQGLADSSHTGLRSETETLRWKWTFANVPVEGQPPKTRDARGWTASDRPWSTAIVPFTVMDPIHNPYDFSMTRDKTRALALTQHPRYIGLRLRELRQGGTEDEVRKRVEKQLLQLSAPPVYNLLHENNHHAYAGECPFAVQTYVREDEWMQRLVKHEWHPHSNRRELERKLEIARTVPWTRNVPLAIVSPETRARIAREEEFMADWLRSVQGPAAAEAGQITLLDTQGLVLGRWSRAEWARYLERIPQSHLQDWYQCGDLTGMAALVLPVTPYNSTLYMEVVRAYLQRSDEEHAFVMDAPAFREAARRSVQTSELDRALVDSLRTLLVRNARELARLLCLARVHATARILTTEQRRKLLRPETDEEFVRGLLVDAPEELHPGNYIQGWKVETKRKLPDGREGNWTDVELFARNDIRELPASLGPNAARDRVMKKFFNANEAKVMARLKKELEVRAIVRHQPTSASIYSFRTPPMVSFLFRWRSSPAGFNVEAEIQRAVEQSDETWIAREAIANLRKRKEAPRRGEAEEKKREPDTHTAMTQSARSILGGGRKKTIVAEAAGASSAEATFQPARVAYSRFLTASGFANMAGGDEGKWTWGDEKAYLRFQNEQSVLRTQAGNCVIVSALWQSPEALDELAFALCASGATRLLPQWLDGQTEALRAEVRRLLEWVWEEKRGSVTAARLFVCLSQLNLGHTRLAESCLDAFAPAIVDQHSTSLLFPPDHAWGGAAGNRLVRLHASARLVPDRIAALVPGIREALERTHVQARFPAWLWACAPERPWYYQLFAFDRFGDATGGVVHHDNQLQELYGKEGVSKRGRQLRRVHSRMNEYLLGAGGALAVQGGDSRLWVRAPVVSVHIPSVQAVHPRVGLTTESARELMETLYTNIRTRLRVAKQHDTVQRAKGGSGHILRSDLFRAPAARLLEDLRTEARSAPTGDNVLEWLANRVARLLRSLVHYLVPNAVAEERRFERWADCILAARVPHQLQSAPSSIEMEHKYDADEDTKEEEKEMERLRRPPALEDEARAAQAIALAAEEEEPTALDVLLSATEGEDQAIMAEEDERPAVVASLPLIVPQEESPPAARSEIRKRRTESTSALQTKRAARSQLNRDLSEKVPTTESAFPRPMDNDASHASRRARERLLERAILPLQKIWCEEVWIPHLWGPEVESDESRFERMASLYSVMMATYDRPVRDEAEAQWRVEEHRFFYFHRCVLLFLGLDNRSFPSLFRHARDHGSAKPPPTSAIDTVNLVTLYPREECYLGGKDLTFVTSFRALRVSRNWNYPTVQRDIRHTTCFYYQPRALPLPLDVSSPTSFYPLLTPHHLDYYRTPILPSLLTSAPSLVSSLWLSAEPEEEEKRSSLPPMAVRAPMGLDPFGAESSAPWTPALLPPVASAEGVSELPSTVPLVPAVATSPLLLTATPPYPSMDSNPGDLTPPYPSLRSDAPRTGIVPTEAELAALFAVGSTSPPPVGGLSDPGLDTRPLSQLSAGVGEPPALPGPPSPSGSPFFSFYPNSQSPPDVS